MGTEHEIVGDASIIPRILSGDGVWVWWWRCIYFFSFLL
jgi:hypothetical protein